MIPGIQSLSTNAIGGGNLNPQALQGNLTSIVKQLESGGNTEGTEGANNATPTSAQFMSQLESLGIPNTGPITSIEDLEQFQLPKIGEGISKSPSATFSPSSTNSPTFTDLIGDLVREVDNKGKTSVRELKKVMTGEVDNLHQSMVAMQEASISFTLMVEVRNKLMESYQQVMRMQV